MPARCPVPARYLAHAPKLGWASSDREDSQVGDSRADVRFRSDVTVELVRHSATDSDVLFAARV